MSDTAKTTKTIDETPVASRPNFVNRLLAWARTEPEDKKPKRSFGSLLGEAAVTAGAAMAIYLLVMYVVSIITPNAMLLVAELMGIDLNTASMQGIIAYWLAPSAVLLVFIVIAVVAACKTIWRLRNRLVARLRGKAAGNDNDAATSAPGKASKPLGRATQTKKRR